MTSTTPSDEPRWPPVVATANANEIQYGTLYPAYEAAAFNSMLQLEDRHKLNLEGILTWAFEFEDQPYFDGFRTLATNGIDKPVLNFFRMAGMLHGDQIKTQSDGAVGLDTMLTAGVRDRPTVDALATRSSRGISVMVWNYQDEDVAGPAATVHLELEGLPKDTTHVLVRHYRIDQDHSNAYTVWKNIGSPQQPSAEQYAKK